MDIFLVIRKTNVEKIFHIYKLMRSIFCLSTHFLIKDNIKPILLLLALVAFYTSVHAQKIRFYPKNHDVYPKITDLTSGIVQNETDSVVLADWSCSIAVNQKIIYQKENLTQSIQPGISVFNADSTLQPSSFLTANGHLLPGSYRVKILFLLKNGDSIHQFKEFNVPPFEVTYETKEGQQYQVKSVPADPSLQLYLISAKQGKLRHHPKPISATLMTNCLINKQQFIKDTTKQNTMLFKSELYYKGILVGKTEYQHWHQLASVKMDTSKNIVQQKRPIVALNSFVLLESGYTNITYPNQLSQPIYTRFTVNPTVSLLGIPFTFNSTISTENNTLFPVNAFQLGIDGNQFKSYFSQHLITQQVETEQRLVNHKQELSEVSKSIYQQKQKLRDKQQLQMPLDTAMVTDSISGIRNNQFRQRKARNEQEALNKLKELEQREEFLKTTLQKDSLLLHRQKHQGLYNDTLNRLIKNERYKGLVRGLLALNEFKIGLVTPNYSPHILSQAPIYGVHVDMEFKRWFFKTTFGNRLAFQPSLGLRNLNVPKFNNKTFATQLGIIDRRYHLKVYGGYYYFKNQPNNFATTTSENHVISSGVEGSKVKDLMVKLEVAKSFFVNDVNGREYQNYNGINNAFSNNNGYMAYLFETKYRLSGNTFFDAKIRKLDAGYYSLGMPFLRTDLIEYGLTWGQYYWHKQLETTLQYTLNRDNLLGNKSNTTILKGYGATLKTHFRNKPNILVSYQPFNSQLIVQNKSVEWNEPAELITQQFYVLHVVVFYHKKINSSQLQTTTSYNRSVNQNSIGMVYKQETYQGNVAFVMVGGKQINYQVAAYETGQKATSGQLHDVAFTWPLLKRKINLTTGLTGQYMKDQKTRQGVYTITSYTLKTLVLSCRLSINYLQGAWGTLTNGNPEQQAYFSISHHF